LAKGFIDTFGYLHGDATGMYTWWPSVSKQAKRTIQAGELTISWGVIGLWIKLSNLK